MPVVGDRADRLVEDRLVAVHFPHRDGAGGVVVPQDVGTAVTIEVAGVGDVPGGAGRTHDLVAGDLSSIHLPDRNRAVVVVPEDVAAAVAIEVGDAGLVPGGADGAEGLV